MFFSSFFFNMNSNTDFWNEIYNSNLCKNKSMNSQLILWSEPKSVPHWWKTTQNGPQRSFICDWQVWCGTIVWIPSYTYSLYKLQVRTNSTQRLDKLKHKFSITLTNLEPIKTWPIMFLLSKAQLCFCFVFCFSVFINRLKLRLLRMLQNSILVSDLS